jgi:hypothetical protein
MPLSRSHRRVLDRAAPSSSPESAGDREQPADTAHTRRSRAPPACYGDARSVAPASLTPMRRTPIPWQACGTASALSAWPAARALQRTRHRRSTVLRATTAGCSTCQSTTTTAFSWRVGASSHLSTSLLGWLLASVLSAAPDSLAKPPACWNERVVGAEAEGRCGGNLVSVVGRWACGRSAVGVEPEGPVTHGDVPVVRR